MEDCIFCRIVKGELPSYRVYEDQDYFGFLDIFPMVRGQTLLIPKKHKDSYAFALNDKELADFIVGVKKVANSWKPSWEPSGFILFLKELR